MTPRWHLMALLILLLVLSAALTVSSRMWMLNSHRDLSREKQKYGDLLDEEHALQVELVSRTDMNTIERRARQELGMVSLRHNQWQILKP